MLFSKKCALIILALLLGYLQVSCEKAENKQESKTHGSKGEVLKVGFLPISAALPLFVALEHSLFEEAGISVLPVKYQNGALMAEDVIAGRIAAACPGPVDVYLSKELDSPGKFKIYLQTAYTPLNFIYSILVKKNSGIKRIEDLKGKRIGVFPGVTNKLLLEILLMQKFGWKSGVDVNIQGVAPALQLDALETGEYDALCPLEPTGTIGAFRPQLQMIERGPIEREVLNPLYITAHALSTDVIHAHPSEMHRFVQSMERAVDWIRADEQAARVLLPKYTSLTVEQARLTPIGETVKVAEASRADFQKLSDLLARKGALLRPLDIENLYYVFEAK